MSASTKLNTTIRKPRKTTRKNKMISSNNSEHVDASSDQRSLSINSVTLKNSINQLTDKSVEEQASCSPSSSETSKPDEAKPENGPTPPPSGTSSKSVPKKNKIPGSIEQMFETFNASPSGAFKPTFYNPFAVKHRRTTSRSQLKILEKTFMENCKPSPSIRKTLAQELNMSARSIQVWFQNRRAKSKTLMKTGKLTEDQVIEYMAQEEQDDDNRKHDSPSSFEDSEPSDAETVTSLKTGRSSFCVKRRSIPSSFKNNIQPVPFCEIMSFGNSYPNQVRNRSYSLPDIQRSPQLPFKQLQEALFGNPTTSSSATSANDAVSVSTQQQAPSGIASEPSEYYNPPCNPPYNSLYNPSLNAFQNYFRASDEAMSRVSNNYNNTLAGYYAAAQNEPPHHINLPQLSIPPLGNDYQYVNPGRFRPRSSSFAYGNRDSNAGYDLLAAIKEDSPISEYMGLPTDSYSNNRYFDEVEQHHEPSGITHQINSLDLDYFMAPSYQDHSSYSSSNCDSEFQSPIHQDNDNYINELAYLPQPTTEILLSALIDDEHFLH